MMSIKEIDKLAELSRLALAPEEKEELRKDMDSILGYVEQIQKVSSKVSGDKKTGSLRNVLRADLKPHESGIFTEVLLSAAPKREGDYVRVKKII